MTADAPLPVGARVMLRMGAAPDAPAKIIGATEHSGEYLIEFTGDGPARGLRMLVFARQVYAPTEGANREG